MNSPIANNKPHRVVLCRPDGTPYKASGLTEKIDENQLKYAFLITQKLYVPKTFAVNGSGDPTHIEETGIGTDGLKRITDISYNASGDPETQEIRLTDADDNFLYGIRNTFVYAAGSLQSVSTELLIS